MIYLDIDFEHLKPNWETDLMIIFFDLAERFKCIPQVRVSARGGGWHIIIPGSPDVKNMELIRMLYDCPGHAALTEARAGADICFSRRGTNTVTPARDIFHAIDIFKSMR